MPTQPAICVILPTFNRVTYLRAAVDSVLAQTFSDWELIIADDGSSHETRTYLATLMDLPRVRQIWLSHTGNPATVRNCALREARGKYVAFLDSDDLWAPTKLEVQMKAMRSRADRRWSYTAFTRVDELGATLAEERRRKWVPYEGWIFPQLVRGEASVRTPSVIAELELIEQAGGFDEKHRSSEDYDLWMRLALRSAVTLVDVSLVRVRLHAENYSSADWPASFMGRDYSLGKLQGLADLRWRPLLRRERAKNSLVFASKHAIRSAPSEALRALWGGVSYSWPYPRWWWGASKILAKLILSMRVGEAPRWYRHGA